MPQTSQRHAPTVRSADDPIIITVSPNDDLRVIQSLVVEALESGARVNVLVAEAGVRALAFRALPTERGGGHIITPSLHLTGIHPTIERAVASGMLMFDHVFADLRKVTGRERL